jgi:hypothetical protein
MAGRLTPVRRAGTRRRTLAVLAVAVLAVHGCITGQLADRMADLTRAAAMPPRLEVAYVRELELAPPPVVAAPVAPPPAAAPPVARPASAPRPRRPRPSPPPRAEPAPEPAPEAQVAVVPDPPAAAPQAPASPPSLPDPAAATAPAALAAASAASAASDAGPAVASAPAAPASGAVAFEWPPSTRLRYKLVGNVRGEIHGDAQVEWVRVGTRYQVHLDISVGALLDRRMSSDGELTAQGLVPQRYDEETKALFRAPRRLTMHFGADALQLATGRSVARPAGVQDTASQFVQLAWLFGINPQLLRPGATVELPLALPRRVDVWQYEVVGEEPVYTPFGAVEAFHLKPRRLSRPGGELSAEMWFAPRLRYLPVRIRIQQDAQTYIDLVIARRPELGEADKP